MVSVVNVEFGRLGLFFTLGNITPRLRVVERCDDEFDVEVDIGVVDVNEIGVIEGEIGIMGVVDGVSIVGEASGDDIVGSSVVIVVCDGVSPEYSAFRAMYLPGLINL